MMSRHYLRFGALIALVVLQAGCGLPGGSAPNNAPPEAATKKSEGSKTATATGTKASAAAKIPRRSTRTPCGDARDALIKAYEDQGIPVDLTCADFTRSRRTATLDFTQLFRATAQDWALLRDPMLASKDKGYGLDILIDAYGAPRSINSSYRDPIRNQQAGGAKRSRHLFGDAVDVDDVTNSLEEWQRLWTAAAKANADYIEPQSGPCKLNCLHADWRNHDGGYRP
jgi:uncharacterized protein YcbK (DUF882 family)